MLHLLPVEAAPPRPAAYAEAVSRLAGVRHALRLVEPYAGGPAPDDDQDAAVAAAWDGAGEARRNLFDRRSEHLVGATAAGLEALLIQQGDGRAPQREASHALVEEIRRELAEIARVVIG
jgi:hypothetical protein